MIALRRSYKPRIYIPKKWESDAIKRVVPIDNNTRARVGEFSIIGSSLIDTPTILVERLGSGCFITLTGRYYYYPTNLGTGGLALFKHSTGRWLFLTGDGNSRAGIAYYEWHTRLLISPDSKIVCNVFMDNNWIINSQFLRLTTESIVPQPQYRNINMKVVFDMSHNLQDKWPSFIGFDSSVTYPNIKLLHVVVDGCTEPTAIVTDHEFSCNKITLLPDYANSTTHEKCFIVSDGFGEKVTIQCQGGSEDLSFKVRLSL